jgi:hypothetical protein
VAVALVEVNPRCDISIAYEGIQVAVAVNVG